MPPAEVRLPAAARPAARLRRLWILSGGTAALAVSTLAFIVWARWATPDGGQPAAAPRDPTARSTDPGGPGRNPPPPPPVRARREAAPAEAPEAAAGGASQAVGKTATPNAGPDAAAKVIAAGSGPTARTTRRLRLLVPAYIYPSGDGRKEWQKLIDAASKVEIVAIANPNSGPGFDRNPAYAAIFVEASNHGVKLVGYVSTQYAARPRDQVKNDIDAWIRSYPQISGFFFDQQPSEARHQHLDYFAEIRDYARSRLPGALVITNPGIPCDAAYITQAVADVTCVFANFEGFDTFELAAPLKVYDPGRFAALPYNVADVEAMRAVVRDAIVKRIGYIYVSDVKPPTQWGHLPVYWDAEVEVVSRLQ
jgi:hypothetical protein